MIDSKYKKEVEKKEKKINIKIYINFQWSSMEIHMIYMINKN